MKNNKETTGEDLISDFLDEKGIDFERYVPIKNLKDDDKFFREADFYLPQKKVYIEFMGQWNNPIHKDRYRKKMRIYYNNKIPCVYLWPDNLGTLDWMLKRRITEVYLRYNMKLQLFNHEFDSYLNKKGLGILILIGLAIYNRGNLWLFLFIGMIVVDVIIESFKRIKKLKKIKELKWVSGTGYDN
jgi:hypothetical protein